MLMNALRRFHGMNAGKNPEDTYDYGLPSGAIAKNTVGEGHQTSLAGLKGKRLACVEEAMDIYDESIVKLTTGETKIQPRDLYQSQKSASLLRPTQHFF